MDIKLAISLVGFVAAGVIGTETRYTHSEDFSRHVAESKTGTILDIIGRAQGATGDYKRTLCDLLIRELNAVCEDAPTHPLCEDRSMYVRQAGCGLSRSVAFSERRPMRIEADFPTPRFIRGSPLRKAAA